MSSAVLSGVQRLGTLVQGRVESVLPGEGRLYMTETSELSFTMVAIALKVVGLFISLTWKHYHPLIHIY